MCVVALRLAILPFILLFYYFYRFLLSNCVCQLLIKFMMMMMMMMITVTTPICQPTTSSRSTLPAKHHRPTGFLCGWSVGVEFFAGLLARFWCWQRQIQTTFEHLCVRFDGFALAHTAH